MRETLLLNYDLLNVFGPVYLRLLSAACFELGQTQVLGEVVDTEIRWEADEGKGAVVAQVQDQSQNNPPRH